MPKLTKQPRSRVTRNGQQLNHEQVYQKPPRPCVGDVIHFADGQYRVVGHNAQGMPVLVRLGVYDDGQ